MTGRSLTLAAFQYHGEPHAALRTYRDETVLDVAAAHLVRERRDETAPGRAERMPDRDRTPHHVDDVLVDLPPLGGETLEIRQHLRRECLVNLDQAEVLPLDSGALQRLGHRKDRRLEQLPAGIDRGNRVRPDEGEGLISERPRRFVAHQQDRRGAVGEGRGVRGGNAAVAAIEDGLELRHLLERRVASDAVVLRDDRLAGTGGKPGHDLRREPAVGRALRRQLVAAQRPAVLLLARDMFSFAIFSADWPIDSPVDGSAIAGAIGTRSRGRIFAKVLMRAPSDLALLASTRISASRREARMGMSDSASAPPAMITFALPSAI